ncbi:MAG: TetR/AcrR family transcriptional regulator [Candidatus Nomurabacteria bacterium]|jgi:AcrR family transcriptional regulator|nr:TetR/AcrR family transcriptional regulator [Candidatus Nomurabacteria bacterium]
MKNNGTKIRENAQVNRSKRKLRKGLTELLQSRTIDNITIQNLCRVAGVDRTTFYKYYKSVNELFDYIESQVMADFEEAIDAMPAIKNPDEVVRMCLEVIDRHRDVARVVFAHKDDNTVQRILYMYHDQCIDYWKTKFRCDNPKTLESLWLFYTSGVIGTIVLWTQGRIRSDTENLAKFISRACEHGISGFMRRKS